MALLPQKRQHQKSMITDESSNDGDGSNRGSLMTLIAQYVLHQMQRITIRTTNPYNSQIK